MPIEDPDDLPPDAIKDLRSLLGGEPRPFASWSHWYTNLENAQLISVVRHGEDRNLWQVILTELGRGWLEQELKID